MKKTKENTWDKVITSNLKDNHTTIQELWDYREMVMMLIKRNFITGYKQTLLGPAWAFISPFITTIVFTFIFGNLVGLSTNGIPQFLYYFCALIFWNYFSGCTSSISSTFVSGGGLMSKVYFPRLIIPITTVCSGFISFGIQLLLLIGFYIFYLILGANIHITLPILLIPIYFLQLILLSLGVGSFFASITTKYKDLSMVIGFIIQMWMYITPIAYSSSIIAPKFYFLYHLNPVTNTIEWIIYSFFGVGNPSVIGLIYSIGISILAFLIGIRFFRKSEKTFIDTI